MEETPIDNPSSLVFSPRGLDASCRQTAATRDAITLPKSGMQDDLSFTKARNHGRLTSGSDKVNASLKVARGTRRDHGPPGGADYPA